jgi:glycosyltransferase involved in cell wall biosynthesis
MATHWQTEVITTCALDYVTWQNWYPAGTEHVDGTTIRRFPVDQPRDPQRFDSLSDELCAKGAQATLDEQENWMRAQGPVSTQLWEYLKRERENYDAFIFFGYLYATTYFGLPIVRDKAFLAPLTHDEWPIYLNMWDCFMTLPKAIIFNSPEEKEFFKKRFSTYQGDDPIIGVGFDEASAPDPAAFRKKYSLTEPFLLYVGRVDESKGCREFIEWFIRLRRSETAPRKLLLIGREVMPIPYHPDIVHLGFVSEEEKWAAMAACDWLVNHSTYESLSMTILEAWLTERPCLVNGKSDVLVGHCQRSNGGLWYNTFNEWAAAIKTIDEPTKAALGQQGNDYVRRNYSWKRVEHSYLKLIGSTVR